MTVDRAVHQAIPHDPSKTMWTGCGCDRCARGRAATRHRWAVRSAMGTIPQRAPADEIRAKLERWHQLGFTDYSMAFAAGVSQVTVRHLRVGDWQNLTVHRMQALTAITPTQMIAATPDKSLVPRAGVLRRVQSMAWMGWGPADTELGDAVRNIIYKDQRVTAAVHRRVAAVYDRVSMVPGPSEPWRERARRYGWVSPLAWDENIDDPSARPDTGPPSALPAVEAFIENVLHLRESGVSPERICDQLDVLPRTAEQRMRRHDHPELAKPFAVAATKRRVC